VVRLTLTRLNNLNVGLSPIQHKAPSTQRVNLFFVA
ncbi:MAG: hypothetical protein ACI9SX_001735, partial [Pseudoalteromonas tetraodonis]